MRSIAKASKAGQNCGQGQPKTNAVSKRAAAARSPGKSLPSSAASPPVPAVALLYAHCWSERSGSRKHAAAAFLHSRRETHIQNRQQRGAARSTAVVAGKGFPAFWMHRRLRKVSSRAPGRVAAIQEKQHGRHVLRQVPLRQSLLQHCRGIALWEACRLVQEAGVQRRYQHRSGLWHLHKVSSDEFIQAFLRRHEP